MCPDPTVLFADGFVTACAVLLLLWVVSWLRKDR